jgi:hypothetical protein
MATVASHRQSHRADHLFFSGVATLILASVFIGFARSYFFAGVIHAPLPNLLIHLHAAVFSLWITLLITQIALVSVGWVDLHRQLGILATLLATAMIFTGFLAATDSLARGFSPPGSGLDAKSFYAMPVLQIVAFSVLVVWGFRSRFDGPAHKRLMLLATISIIGPAINRWPIPAIHRMPVLTSLAIDLFVVSLAGFDIWSKRSIHRATMQGGLVIILSQHLMVQVGLSRPWHVFATLMQHFWNTSL